MAATNSTVQPENPAEDSDELGSLQSDPTVNPATTTQTIVAAVLIVVSTIFAGWGWLAFVSKAGDLRTKEFNVVWNTPEGVTLAPGPIEFVHKPSAAQLVYRGPISEDVSTELEGLIYFRGKAIHPPNPRGKTYWRATTKLTFASHENDVELYVLLLVIGGMSGVAGVQLRSLVNFVYVACFQNKLDVNRWWPWYAVRPVQGFVLGLLAFLLVEVGLLTSDEATVTDASFGIIAAALAGFSAAEFTQRLRQLSQSIFGGSNGDGT